MGGGEGRFPLCIKDLADLQVDRLWRVEIGYQKKPEVLPFVALEGSFRDEWRHQNRRIRVTLVVIKDTPTCLHTT